MKISLENVESTLLERKVDPVKVQEILADLRKALEEEKEEREKEKEKVKWEYVIVLHDKNGFLTEKEIAGWVVQQEENADAGTILSNLQRSAVDQNETVKRKNSVITDFVNLFESLKPKFLKEKKLRIKTKELTRVIVTDGKFQ